MIIEFIGSTGAGKTTLIAEVQRHLNIPDDNTTDVTTPFDLISAKSGLGNLTNTTIRNLIQEIYGLWYLIPALPHHKKIIAFSLKLLLRKTDSIVLLINNIRSLIRKIGIYELIRRQPENQIILVDEGTVLLAHILFVYNKAYYAPEEIAQFASMIPLPDVVVYIKAPLDSLINRSLERTNPPREMKSKEPALVQKYVTDAVTMFDQLVQIKEIQERVLIVDNPDNDGKQPSKAAGFIADYLLSHREKQRAGITL